MTDPGAGATDGATDDATAPHPELLEEIAASVGTPTYVYIGETLDAAAARWAEAAGPRGVWYAVKANGNLSLLRRLGAHGIGFEVATPGEYGRARAAGIPAGRIAFGGVPKREEDVAFALGERPDAVILQADHEAVAALRHADPARPVSVGIRVRPGIRAGAHPSLETGVRDAKFGWPPEEAARVWGRLAAVPGLEPRILAVHLGSGIEDADPFLRAADLLAGLAGALERDGPPVRELDLGGGLGIGERGGPPPEPAAVVAGVRERVGERRIRFEPGRSVVARAGLLLTRVLYRYEAEGTPAVVCDAAFTDFARPVLYGARHRVERVGGGRSGPADVRVLGATCESGDMLGKEEALRGAAPDDLLAVRDAGAYGFVMASNYNGRPRPAEVVVDGAEWKVVRRRETVEELWRGEEVREEEADRDLRAPASEAPAEAFPGPDGTPRG